MRSLNSLLKVDCSYHFWRNVSIPFEDFLIKFAIIGLWLYSGIDLAGVSFMKRHLFTTSLASMLFSACAGATFHKVNDDGSLVEGDIGLHYYMPVPHLLVQRPGNKDGATTTSIIYLPDLSQEYAIKYKSGLGSGKMEVTLANGILASFNQESDSKIPETLANLAAPISGVAAATASVAASGLSDAQADLIRKRIDAGLLDPSALGGYNPLTPFDNACPPNPAKIKLADPPHNDQISPASVLEIISAANHLACASELLNDQALFPKKAGEAAAAARRLPTILFDLSQDARDSLAATLGIDGSPEAAILRSISKAFSDFDAGQTSEALKIEDTLNRAVSLLNDAADTIEPPKPSKNLPTFELYRIVMDVGYTAYHPVGNSENLCADPALKATLKNICTP
ncbi:MAG: hypothetical protein KJ871_00285 [Alphaproteobacteria bacterium]|nr:hypothetical protein [Alphaproteobacteria bacterium]MBU2083771.1 hypothetical protein [Alphaproteobacteria bacterium]MBU2142556.1 hypothetical protein [Alphaproteobacteria bacterium]MBU2197690.1 hypothetical protein [Alphaproteobacteria bacterium]